MRSLIPLITLMILLVSSTIILTDGTHVKGADAEDIERFSNVTISPEPDSELDDLKDPVTITFDNPINTSTLGMAVIVDNNGLPGRVYFVDNNTIQYIPEWGYAYGRNVTFSIMGGSEGLTWENGTQALEENITFNLSMPYPDRYLIPLQYQDMTEVKGQLTLFTEEGTSIETFKSGSNGLFPLPEDFTGGFGVFDNGNEVVEIRIVRYGGPIFLAWDHVAFIDYSPILMFGAWDSTTGNITFSFSHLMDRVSVEENIRMDGLRGEFIWKGRDLTIIPDNRDKTESYNVTIPMGTTTVWGEGTLDDIWIKIEASEEKDKTINYFVLFMGVILVLILFAGFTYGKASYSGPKE
jgi:hypothetical protein